MWDFLFRVTIYACRFGHSKFTSENAQQIPVSQYWSYEAYLYPSTAYIVALDSLAPFCPLHPAYLGISIIWATRSKSSYKIYPTFQFWRARARAQLSPRISRSKASSRLI